MQVRRRGARAAGWGLAVLATMTLAVACGDTTTGGSGGAGTTAPVVSGRTVKVPADKPTVQAAVDAAQPGDLILISPGVYKEAVNVTTDNLTIRGEERNTTVLDGEFTRENGVRVLNANGVAVENLTARNYTGNGFFWTGVTGYRGSYLTTSRTGNYGVYAFDSYKGQIDHVYASGSPDAGIYIGQCYRCEAVVTDSVSEYNGLGYSGTNSGGDLYIVNSTFRFNRAGIVPNSGSYEQCYPERETTIAGNLVYSNNQPDTPAIDVALLAMGNGILVAGGRDNLVTHNRVWDHERTGIGLVPFPETDAVDNIPPDDILKTPCSETKNKPPTDKAAVQNPVLWPAKGNKVIENAVERSGAADIAVGTLGDSLASLGNCFSGNTVTTTAPADLQAMTPCSGTGNGADPNNAPLDLVALMAAPRPAKGDYKTQPEPPAQPNMPDPTSAPARPAVDVPMKIDLGTIRTPGRAGDLIPPRRPAWRGWLATLAMAGTAAASGCAATGATSAPVGPTSTSVVVPAVHQGPQGDGGQFVVKCGFSHAATDDPIVHPGHAGRSHRHDFFGNVATDATSTAASLLGRDTTCNLRLDTAAYWAPSLFDHDQPVTPQGSVIYYRPAPGVAPTTLAPYPLGLMMLSGDPTAATPQPVEIAGWACGASSDVRSEPPVCDPASPLQVRITFPDCWNGAHLDSTDHRAHVARSQRGRCPVSHPVVLPQLTVTVRYPIAGPGHDLALASGPTRTAHADFLNAWDEHELTQQVELCLHRSVVCSVASNRGQHAPIL